MPLNPLFCFVFLKANAALVGDRGRAGVYLGGRPLGAG